ASRGRAQGSARRTRRGAREERFASWRPGGAEVAGARRAAVGARATDCAGEHASEPSLDVAPRTAASRERARARARGDEASLAADEVGALLVRGELTARSARRARARDAGRRREDQA